MKFASAAISEVHSANFVDSLWKLSREQLQHKHLLRESLDGLRAVVVPDPVHGVVGMKTGQRRHACDGCSRAVMTTQASNLDCLTVPNSLQHGRQRGDPGRVTFRDSEVRPIKILVRPWWSPLAIEIEAVVRLLPAIVRIKVVERHGGDPNSAREYDS